MAARGGRNNLVARRVIDDLIDISGERSPLKYLKIFIEQKITDHRRFISRMRDEIRTSTNLISQLNALIVELEASGDYEEVFNLVMELRDDNRDEQDKWLISIETTLLRVIDDLIDISRERSPLKYLKIFMEPQITDHYQFITRMRDEIWTLTNHISQLNALIAELEASGNYEEVFDLVMELRDDRSNEKDKVADFNMLIVVAEEKIHGKEINLEMLEAEGNDGYLGQVNYDNDNENDDLEYQSEEYFDEVQEDDENNHSNGNVVKRGITRKKRYFDVDLTVKKLVMDRLGQLLRNFRRKLRQTYILPNQNKLSKLNEVPTKYNTILKAEEWVDFVKYTTIKEYKVKSSAAKTARSKSVYQHTTGRDRKKEIELDEELARGTLWLKGIVNKDGEYPDDEIRSVGDKLKETEDKIKEVTLKVDHGTDAMTVLLGKEKGGYARGEGSGVTYKSADEEGGTTVVGCENYVSIQKSNGLATLEKEMETRAFKCKLWHFKKLTIIALGTVYKTDRKQMLHNKELPKDCYKVSIDTSLLDAACILNVGNNGFKTVKDAAGGFFAWPKDQVVFDPKKEKKEYCGIM
nr:hypothetical protein [Tanacetum cinerariifolium]